MLILALLILEIARPATSYAAQNWAVIADKAVVVAGTSSVVNVSITNLSTSNGGGEAIGCVKLSIPGGFTILSVSVKSVSRGLSWSTTYAGQNVTIQAASDSNRLTGAPDLDQIVVAVAVLPAAAGVYRWNANEFGKPDCSNAYGSPLSIPMVIAAAPTPTPAPTATPTPTPDPTPGPTPAPTRTPSPTPKPTPAPTRTPAPTGPTATATEAPSNTDGPSPSVPGDPTPDPTQSGPPQASSAPTPQPSPSGGTIAFGRGTVTLAGGSGGSGGGMDAAGADLAAAVLDSLGMGTWAVGTATVGGFALLVLFAVMAQVGGGLIWLPLIRRRIGDFGLGRPRKISKSRVSN